MMRKFIASALLLLMVQAVNADHAYRESDLQTLMTSPDYRASIDNRRSGRLATSDTNDRIRPSEIRVDGLVKRSDGKSIVWVNGQDSSQVRSEGIRVPDEQTASRSVKLFVEGRRVDIKPGETWSAETED